MVSLFDLCFCWLNSVSACRQMIRTDFWQSLRFSTVILSPQQRQERETQSATCEAEEKMGKTNSVIIRGKG